MAGWLASSKIKKGKKPTRSRVSVPKFGVDSAKKAHNVKQYMSEAKISKRWGESLIFENNRMERIDANKSVRFSIETTIFRNVFASQIKGRNIPDSNAHGVFIAMLSHVAVRS